MRRALLPALAVLALAGAPAAHASRTVGLDAAGAVHAFVVGTDGALYHAPPGGVLGRSGGEGLVQEPVGVVRDATGELVIVARSVDGTVYALPGGEWSAREPVAAGAAGAPDAVLNGTGALEVFFRGVDGKLWATAQTVTGWSDPEALGGTLVGEPVAILDGAGVVNVFAREQNTGLFWARTDGTAPSAVGNPTSSDPAVARHADGRLELFARGPDLTLWHTVPDGSDPFGDWRPLLTSRIAGAPAAAVDGTGTVHAFARAADASLIESAPSVTSLGGTLGGEPAAIRDRFGLLHVVAPSTGGGWVARAQTASRTWEPLFRSLGEAAPTKAPETPVVVPAPVPTPEIVSPVYPPVRIVVDLKASAKASKRSTVFKALTLRGVPAGTTVTATCAKGCKRTSLTLTNVAGNVSLKPFFAKRAKQGTLKVGTKVRVVVSGPNMVSAVKTLTVRARRAPSVATRCIAPGTTTEQVCA